MSNRRDGIVVRYESIDGFRKQGTFGSLELAQEFAQKWVGETPELSITYGYAVSNDGVAKVTCSGVPIDKLFPKSWWG